MIKLFIKLNFALSLLLTSISHATILPLNVNDLTTADYIVFNYEGVDYDVAWASQVSSEIWFTDSDYNYNLLFAAEIHSDWSFAGQNGIPQIDDIFSKYTGAALLAKFTRGGEFVNAFEYWNSFFDTPENGFNLDNKEIASTWNWNIPLGSDIEDIEALSPNEKEDLDFYINDLVITSYDTFYVRKTITSVPEPSTLMIFALGLIALASKKRLIS